MNSKTYHNALSTLVLGFLCLPFSLWAQDGASQTNVENEVEIGFDFLSDDSFRYGKFSGYTDDGASAIFDFKLESQPAWDSGDITSWRLQGWRLGLESRRIEFDFKQQGVQKFNADYREIPNNQIGLGFLPYSGFGSNFLALPANWEITPGSNNTAGFLSLDDSQQPVSIERKRRRLNLNYDRILNKSWNITVDFRHETKDGERTIGSIFGNSGGNPRGVILPAPVDFTTDIVETNFEYARDGVLFGFGFYASYFNNDEKTLGWENAFGTRSGWAPGVGFPDGIGQLALEPDNSYIQFRANSALSIGTTSRLSAEVSFGTMDQDDPLLPYTINPALTVDVPLPRVSADAKIDTLMFNLRWTSQPLRGLSLRANYHYDDRDNKTPRSTYLYVGGDSQNQKDEHDGRINLPYSYTEQKTDFGATYRLTRGVRLKAGVKYSDFSRTYAEVLDSDEITYMAGVKFSGWEKVGLRLDYEKSSRDISDYQGNRPLLLSTVPGEHAADDWENHPQLRKYHETDRDRTEYRARVDFFPNSKINLGLTGSYNQDDYGDGFFGLNEATVEMWTIDAGFYPRENVNLSAYYTHENYDSSQSSRTFRNTTQAADPTRNWFANSEDDVDTYNVSLNLQNVGKNEALELGFDYTYSNTESMIAVTATTQTTAPLPDLRNKLRSYSVYGKYQLNNKSTIRLAVELGKLSSDDFGLDNVLSDTLSNVLLLGESSPQYDLTLVSLSYSYRF